VTHVCCWALPWGLGSDTSISHGYEANTKQARSVRVSVVLHERPGFRKGTASIPGFLFLFTVLVLHCHAVPNPTVQCSAVANHITFTPLTG